MTFTLTSTDLKEGATLGLAQVHGGLGGGNRSPQLAWQGEPAGTQSFAITCYDPDAPTGSGWWHWLLVNLPPSLHELAAGAAMPAGAQSGRNDYGETGFGGAYPPQGDAPHRYLFTVWALDVPRLDLPELPSGAMVGFNLHAHVLAKATLTGRWGH